MTENTPDRGDIVRELADIHASLKVLSAGQEEICRRIDDDIKSRLEGKPQEKGCVRVEGLEGGQTAQFTVFCSQCVK